jgi:hypothetical protein
VTFKEWVESLAPPKDYKQSAKSDIADSIGLIVIMGLLLFVVFV